MTCLNAFSPDDILLSPSILAADFSCLGKDVCDAVEAGADLIHMDIMDGHFVPNISFGPAVIKSLRPLTDHCFDVHLMISEPGRYIDDFIDVGADHITVHVEVEEDVSETLDRIHQGGCSAGLTLRPGTPASALRPYLEAVDMILVMTVEPGFGGQSFMRDMLPKIREIRDQIQHCGRRIHLEVDGGISDATAPDCTAAGANVLVAGSSIFRAEAGIAGALERLRAAGRDGRTD